MKFKYGVLASALVTSALFVLAVANDWIRHFVACESFGCVGLALWYLLISVFVVLCFFLCGIFIGKSSRLASGLFAGGVAAVAMVLSFVAIYGINQYTIVQDWKEYEEVCAQRPELCPEKFQQ